MQIFEIRQSTSLHTVELPIGSTSQGSAPAVVSEVPVGSHRDPNWFIHSGVKAIDIGTEKSAGQKMQRCMVRIWLLRRMNTVLPQSFANLLAALHTL